MQSSKIVAPLFWPVGLAWADLALPIKQNYCITFLNKFELYIGYIGVTNKLLEPPRG